MYPHQVVQYVSYVDCLDNENGHGTHVGGSAAGALSDTSPGEHFGDGVSRDAGGQNKDEEGQRACISG